MKVKNIAFSGFAAAILAGVGAAQAAQQLVTPTYVNAAIDGKVNAVAQRVDTLETQMGEEELSTQVKTVTGAINELNGVVAKVGTIEGDKTVAELLAGKQDALANADVLKTITADDLTAIDTIVDKADADDVYTKSETDGLLNGKQNSFTLKENGGLVWDNGQLTTSGIATDATLTGVQNDVSTLKGLVGDTAVATQIANAVKTETDARVAADDAIDGRLDALETASATHALKSEIENMATTDYVTEQIATIEEYDDTELSGRVTTLENAGYQNAEQVNALIATGTSTLATKQSVTDLDTAYKAADSALDARITTNAGDIADNAGAISALQSNAMVAGPTADGLWLAEKNGDTVSWTQVEILDTYSTGDEN